MNRAETRDNWSRIQIADCIITRLLALCDTISPDCPVTFQCACTCQRLSPYLRYCASVSTHLRMRLARILEAHLKLVRGVNNGYFDSQL